MAVRLGLDIEDAANLRQICGVLLASGEAHAAQQINSEATTVNPIQPQCPLPMPASHPVSPSPTSDPLKADITHQEVEAALKRLKRNEVAGVVGIKAEFILDAASILLTPLVMTFRSGKRASFLVHWSDSSNLQGSR